MSTAVIVLESVQAPLFVVGAVGAVKWATSMTRKVDRLLAIVAPEDEPAMRLDRQLDTLTNRAGVTEARVADHLSWHAQPGAQ